MAKPIHPEATHHLPFFITPPGETDILMNVMMVFLLLIVFLIGILYLRLHALPEHMAHRTQKVQYEIVAVLALISLFTHNHIYWIIGLLLALVQLPDFSTPLSRMADSLAKMAGTRRTPRSVEPVAPVWPPQEHPQPAAREAKDLSHA
jgi:hypothetical protein